jgi:D-glycero-D-manno-heptose 1,7-bisphosphate phosphatase
VKLLIHLAHDRSRLALAAHGLARRGHLIAWSGPAGRHEAAGGANDRWRFRAEAVVTDAGRPLPAAWDGWLSGARCLVGALRHDEVKRWGAVDRWAWSTLAPLGIVEPAEAEAFRSESLGHRLDRIGLWSDEHPPEEPDPAHPDVEVLERACERAIARQRSHARRPAVFLDRDGTLLEDSGYMSDPDDVRLFPGVAGTLRSLAASGYALVVISNQAGVGRGLFDLTRAYEVMARLRTELRAEGVELDAVYLCPHRPDEGCPCRKPSPLLLERAAEDLGLSLPRSVMVGDKWIDVEAPHRVGALGVLVRTGYGQSEERQPIPGWRPADAIVDDLPAFAAWLARRPVRED